MPIASCSRSSGSIRCERLRGAVEAQQMIEDALVRDEAAAEQKEGFFRRALFS